MTTIHLLMMLLLNLTQMMTITMLKIEILLLHLLLLNILLLMVQSYHLVGVLLPPKDIIKTFPILMAQVIGLLVINQCKIIIDNYSNLLHKII